MGSHDIYEEKFVNFHSLDELRRNKFRVVDEENMFEGKTVTCVAILETKSILLTAVTTIHRLLRYFMSARCPNMIIG